MKEKALRTDPAFAGFKRLTFIMLLAFTLSFSSLKAQPTIDGDVSDGNYITLATKQNSNAGFGPNIDVNTIYYYPDDANSMLYVGIEGKLDVGSSNGIGLWLDFNELTGESAGTSLGTGGGHYMGGNGGTNPDFKADFEVDYMFAMNPGSSADNVYYDLVRSEPGNRLTQYLGNSDQSGTTLSNNDGPIFSGGTVSIAFNNGGGDDQGFEISIPYGELGVTHSGEMKAFAVVVSSTAYFSDVTVPGNVTGGSPGFDANFNALGGSPYHGDVTYSTVADGSWNTGATWASGNVPPNGGSVTIANAITQDIDRYADDLTINNGASLNINQGINLTVDGTLTNNGDQTSLVIQSDATGTGSLIESDGVAATAQQYVEGAEVGNNDKWHLVAQPVNEINSMEVFLNCYLKEWQEANNTYANVGNTDLSTAMKGYSMMYSYNPGAPTSKTLEFTGLLNTGNQSIGFTADNSTWNLLGNPYPCAIDWDQVSKPAEFLTNAFYVWDDATDSYNYYLNGDPGSSATQYIPAMQGFFVDASSAGTLSLDNTVKAHDTPGFYKNSEELENVLFIQSENDQATVRFVPEATAGFDKLYDATKLFSGYDHNQELFTTNNGDKLISNALPSIEDHPSVTLGFKTGNNGDYTLNFEGMESFAPDQPIYLYDTKTDVMVDLRENSSYTFNYNVNDLSERFTIYFKNATGMDESSKSPVSIFADDHEIVVKSAKEGLVEVFMLSGQKVYKQELSGQHTERIKLNDQTGFFLVRVTQGSKVHTAKVVVK
ncbi:MAG: T9SS type A sorting domain-containing protein [Bacteroidales bacterium]|nr:T9SS type A sorting domain-containing protein [Bacteroidales bacterium]